MMLVNKLNYISESLKNKSNLKILDNAVTSGNISHAYLFSGSSIDLLADIALNFSASINCDENGCGSCRICQNTLKGIYDNVLLVEADGPILTVDRIREIQHFMAISAHSPGKKICIIKEAELMNDISANSLLKILEEPPDRNSMFILLTESLSSILPTISSRCIIFDWDFKNTDNEAAGPDRNLLRDILDAGIKRILESKSNYETSLDLSISIADFFKEQGPPDNDERKEQVSKLKDTGATASEMKKFEDTLKAVSKRKRNKYYNLGMKLVFDIITAWLEDIISVIAGADANAINYPANFEFIKKNADFKQIDYLIKIINIVEKNRSYLKYSIYDEIALDNIFLKLQSLGSKERGN